MNGRDADRVTEDLIRPIRTTGPGYYAVLAILVSLSFIGVFAYVNQLIKGLGVTGMNNSVAWGVYITNFVFFIGISLAGTLISAILHLTHAEWRRPITRAAEAITVIALIFAMISIFVDLGRPDRFLNLFLYSPVISPMIWDIFVICVYLLSSVFYLYLALIPDLATLRDVLPEKSWRKKMSGILALGWQGNPEQKRRLKKAIGFMAVFIIPIAIMVHTVTAWIFGMTVRAMWHSTILGPYFVATALFSGIATIILALVIVRKVFNLENYLKPVHFDNLRKLLIVMAGLWLYFTFTEYLTTGYGALPEEMKVFSSKVTGDFRFLFWSMIGCVMISFFLLLFKKKWIISATTFASLFILVGVWLERFIIVVPTLTKELSEGYKAGIYYPTLTEGLITLGCLSGFALLYAIFLKLFPIISIWEINEAHEAIPVATKRIEAYLFESEELHKSKQTEMEVV